MTAPDGLLRDAGGARPRDELDALRERVAWFEASGGVAAHTEVFEQMHRAERADAEVAQLRDNGTRLLEAADSWKDEAQRNQRLVSGLEAEVARLSDKYAEEVLKRVDALELLERAEAEVARLKDAPIRILQLETERDALAKDAARWDMFAALWAACTELQATQDEDGRWSLTCIEPVEGVPEPGRWTGDNPDAAIDAAKEKP